MSRSVTLPSQSVRLSSGSMILVIVSYIAYPLSLTRLQIPVIVEPLCDAIVLSLRLSVRVKEVR